LVALLVACTLAASPMAALRAHVCSSPTGTYGPTCSDCQVDCGVLDNCKCIESDGFVSYQNGPFNYYDCMGYSVANIDGRLSCQEDQCGTPTGTYGLTCKGCEINCGVLENCNCIENDWWVSYPNAPFNYHDCVNNSVANIDGRLSCQEDKCTTPSGTYDQTCTNCNVNCGVLEHCICKDSDGFTTLQNAPFNYTACMNYSVANIDGSLSCQDTCGKQNQPTGTFNQTCSGCQVNCGVLENCTCIESDARTSYQSAPFNYYSCASYAVANIGGQLTCQEDCELPHAAPTGTYDVTCFNCNVNCGVLEQCTCLQHGGVSRFSNGPFNYYACGNYSVANIDGKLSCQ